MFPDDMDNEKKYKFRMRPNAGAHKFRDKRGTVNRGDIFTATMYEIRNIKHKIELVSGESIQEKIEKDRAIKQPDTRYEYQEVKPGKFVIVNAKTKTPLNDTMLSRAKAEEIVGDLNGLNEFKAESEEKNDFKDMPSPVTNFDEKEEKPAKKITRKRTAKSPVKKTTVKKNADISDKSIAAEGEK